MKQQVETGNEQMLAPGLYRELPRSYRPQNVPVLIQEELMERVGHDFQLLAEITVLFQEDAPVRVAELQTSLGRLDSDGFERAAHALKGMISNFTTGPAFETASALEVLGHSRRWVDTTQLISRLEREIQELGVCLNQLAQPRES